MTRPMIRKPFRVLFLVAISIIIQSCTVTPESEAPVNHFDLNGTVYQLTYGVIEDFGTNYDITGRYYILGLQSDSYQYPSDYFKFTIMSTSTTRIQEGIYYFGNKKPGNFWDVEIGTNLVYDSKDNAVSGERLYADSHLKEGKIYITMEDGDFVFDFELKLASGDSIVTITGYFTDVLHEDIIYY